MSAGEFVVTALLRTAMLGGSVTLMIQGHDWGSEVLSVMGLAGLLVYVCLTLVPIERRTP